MGGILPKVSDIEGEIDLWTAEIEKDFTVIRAEFYEEIIQKAHEICSKGDRRVADPV